MDNELRKQLYCTRDKLIDVLKTELLGPGSEVSIPDAAHEIITDLPEVRYSVGILFPQKEKFKVENGDKTLYSESKINDVELIDMDTKVEMPQVESTISSEDTEKKFINENVKEELSKENSLDEEVHLSTQNMPSSMGITFFLAGNTQDITVQLEFGTYVRPTVRDCCVPIGNLAKDFIIPISYKSYIEIDENNKLLKLKNKIPKELLHDTSLNESQLFKNLVYKLYYQMGTKSFKRIPHKLNVVIHFAKINYIDNNKQLDGTNLKITALRKKIKEGIYSISIMIVNDTMGRYDGTNSIFQPVIKVKTNESTPYRFYEYSHINHDLYGDSEDISLALLYRKKKIYGTGHGTSVDWVINENGIGSIKSNFFPVNEVPQVDFSIQDEQFKDKCLSMKYLSDLNVTPIEEKIDSLKNLVDCYNRWIVALEKKISTEIKSPQLILKAKEHIKKCKEACNRMYAGLVLLKQNNTAWIAFQLANRAMFMQRIHLQLQEKDKYPNDSHLQELLKNLNYARYPDKFNWRPFQIAFLLMSVKGMVDNNSIERDLVDLIWFPTGGGKTEAYLGLTAFTIFYRRLKYTKFSGGTAVIMRYTLRLLTAQQFLRAATLICACESIRQDSLKKMIYPVYPLGKEKITIGLWIGNNHTPNKNKDASYMLNKLTESSDAIHLKWNKDKYNKFQILKCPWCGTKLVEDYSPKGGKIGNWGYKLANGKYFYLHCPQEGCTFNESLPIQVVDEELYKKPPTLLFGTVDKFAMLPWKGEVGAFFGVHSNNRAPELIIQDELHLISGPLGSMVGLYETVIDEMCSHKGIRPKIIASTATIRRAAEQCMALYDREMVQFPPTGIDADDSFFSREVKLSKNTFTYGRKYVGILPSGKTKAMTEIRVIASILQRVKMMDISEEIKDKFWTLALYFNSLRDLGKCSSMIDDDVKDFIRRIALRYNTSPRTIGEAAELTSRISTSQLNTTLEKLERVHYSKEKNPTAGYAINTVLATNMISVGVDIARLNIMLIVGQPKLSSEYIQASSRIGRSFPGIAFTLYDGTKSRDRSYYEQFKSYHESFYRYVEPTVVTPFSKPACERGLHAVVISLIRHLCGIAKDSDAKYFDKSADEKNLKKIKDFIISRISDIDTKLNNQQNQEVIQQQIDNIINDWDERTKINNSILYYGDKFMLNDPVGNEKRLMKIFNSPTEDAAYETMTSMRNVDRNIGANILIWGDGK
jgi:hypothetical protein